MTRGFFLKFNYSGYSFTTITSCTKTFTLAAVLVSSILPSHTQAQESSFVVKRLGLPEGIEFMSPIAMSKRGEVLASSEETDDAFLYRSGKGTGWTKITPPQGFSTVYAVGMSANGAILAALQSVTAVNNSFMVMRKKKTKIYQLDPAFPQSFVTSINRREEVLSSGLDTCQVYKKGKLTATIKPPNLNESLHCYFITDNSLVIGQIYSTAPGQFNNRPFLFDLKKKTYLSIPDEIVPLIYGFYTGNKNGKFIADIRGPDDSAHQFYNQIYDHKSQKLISYDVPAGFETGELNGISDKGIAVGQLYDASFFASAAIHYPGKPTQLLRDLIEPGSALDDYEESVAFTINDKNTQILLIAGNGGYTSGSGFSASDIFIVSKKK